MGASLWWAASIWCIIKSTVLKNEHQLQVLMCFFEYSQAVVELVVCSANILLVCF
jgi:hypothetical protein